MPPTYDLRGQAAFVTTAASGIGLATAWTFAQAAASAGVALVDVDEAAIRRPSFGSKAAGQRMIAVTCDASDQVQVAAAIARTVAEFARLDMA